MIDQDRDPMPFTEAELRVLKWGDRSVALYGVRPRGTAPAANGGCGSLSEDQALQMLAQGMTTKAVADIAGVTRSAVGHWKDKRKERIAALGALT